MSNNESNSNDKQSNAEKVYESYAAVEAEIRARAKANDINSKPDEPYLQGLCNCGCGAKLEENGGLLNKDGTRRKWLPHHHLIHKEGFKKPLQKGVKKDPYKKTKEKKEIRELKTTVKELTARLDVILNKSLSDSMTPPKIKEPPFVSAPKYVSTPPKLNTPTLIISPMPEIPDKQPRPAQNPPPSPEILDSWLLNGKDYDLIPQERICVACKSTVSQPRSENPDMMKWYKVANTGGAFGFICHRCYDYKSKLEKERIKQNLEQSIVQKEKLLNTATRDDIIDKLIEENNELKNMVKQIDTAKKTLNTESWDNYSLRNQNNREKPTLF